jgi:hypothetical protein
LPRGVTERVSVSSTGAEADNSSVVFDAHDSSFVPGDEQVGADLFLHDRQTGELELVNVSNLGERGGAGGPASISADGRFVAFSTLAPNVVAGDTNGHADIFVRNRAPAATCGPLRARAHRQEAELRSGHAAERRAERGPGEPRLRR